MAGLERDFQQLVRKQIQKVLPDSLTVKNDSGYIQGIPDLTVFCGDKWAFIEVKKSPNEKYQPNQEYYLDWANQRAFSATVFPENCDLVLDELYNYFNS